MPLAKFLTILTLSLLPFFALPKPTQAAGPIDYTQITNSSSGLLKTYCDRRKGNQLNLETWYGGKCNPSNPADSIGFGDIIILDLMEKIAGAPDDNMCNFLKLIFQLSQNPTPDNLNQLAQAAPPKSDGAIPILGKLITSIYKSPPASSVDYLAYVKTNLENKHIVSQAFAQITTTGYGYEAVKPVLPLWKAFRNITYLIFIIAFIVYGFLIMFRMKIGSQTAISIETAIPTLVVSLLLITFSYAIAGFLIDLFYVLTGLVFSLLVSAGIIKNMGLVGVVNGMSGGLFWSFIMAELQMSFGWSGRIIGGILNIPTLGGHIITALGLVMGWGLIFWVILIIAIFLTYMKVFWMLLQAYVSILLDIIFSPLLLLGTILPGSKSFSTWITRIFANLSVFTSTMVMFTMAFYFLGGFFMGAMSIGDPPPAGQGIWQPYPLFGDSPGWGDTEGKYAVLGFGMLLMTPKIADMVKKALNVQDLDFGSEILNTLKTSQQKAQQYNKWSSDPAQANNPFAMHNFYNFGALNRFGPGNQKRVAQGANAVNSAAGKTNP